MMTPENRERAEHAHAAMEHHAELIGNDGPNVDPESALRDLLTNLRHFCEANKMDFWAAMLMSEHHFEEEGGKPFVEPKLRERYGYGTSPSDDQRPEVR